MYGQNCRIIRMLAIVIALSVACWLLIILKQLKRVQPSAGNHRSGGNSFAVLSSKTGNASMPKSFIDGAVKENVGARETAPKICDTCCYRYVPITDGVTEQLNTSELRRRNCSRRLPDAIVIGAKKSGTTTLRAFLSYHPDVAFTQNEVSFFTFRAHYWKGLEHYKSLIAYSTPGQIAMETTPGYYYSSGIHARIKKSLPNAKLVIIMKNPIERAVSDYQHMLTAIKRNCLEQSNQPAGQANPAAVHWKKCSNSIDGYYIADTFHDSVIEPYTGRVNSSCRLISRGIYAKHLEPYLKNFQRDQILALDGDAFIHDPYLAVKKMEHFLGIRDYFRRDHFYFDAEKRLFCLNKPIPRNCMSASKGRHHPSVKEETISKLRDFYRPHNKALFKLLGVDFYWSF